jgi:hypothetical protein
MIVIVVVILTGWNVKDGRDVRRLKLTADGTKYRSTYLCLDNGSTCLQIQLKPKMNRSWSDLQ